jgi:hypothetical protein
MALKGDRHEFDTDISFFMNEAAEKGLVVSINTTGSGAAMDNASALATVKANASGAVPLGFLLNDMVDIDLTRQHVNWQKDEVVKGGKVTILRKGWILTDRISGTPTGGQTAYLANSGLVSATQAAGAPVVGTFLSTKDADGFAKVAINLP